jgi:hypothetical protein
MNDSRTGWWPGTAWRGCWAILGLDFFRVLSRGRGVTRPGGSKQNARTEGSGARREGLICTVSVSWYPLLRRPRAVLSNALPCSSRPTELLMNLESQSHPSFNPAATYPLPGTDLPGLPVGTPSPHLTSHQLTTAAPPPTSLPPPGGEVWCACQRRKIAEVGHSPHITYIHAVSCHHDHGRHAGCGGKATLRCAA